jgi:hypothetical protein
MSAPFPQPRFMPCSACGAAVERATEDEHLCDPGRVLDYLMFQLRDEIAAVEREFGAYLGSTRGRFELWWAERERRSRADE